MANRRVLVIGSECAALNTLGFPGEYATTLNHQLKDRGRWMPTTGDGAALVNPQNDRFKAAIRQAFEVAGAEKAQLLIAFIGHGVATGGDDYFLQALNSPAAPDSETAFNFGQSLRERIRAHSGLDGLIVLIDACEAAGAVHGAATRLTDVLGEMDGRMEVLVASGGGAAYGGCFTRSLLDLLDVGIAGSGDNLLPADFVGPLTQACPRQRPRHLAFNGGAAIARPDEEDVGLWLIPNAARPSHALTGRPAAGLLDQVTRRVSLSTAQRRAINELTEAVGSRLRALEGPAGSGKTTLMAFLIRPTVHDTPEVATSLVSAAVFIDATTTAESMATELAAQLRATVAGFAAAHESAAVHYADYTTLGAVEVELRLPLQRVRTEDRRRIHLLIDGVDQAGAANAPAICAAITALTTTDDTRLDHVRVIVGARAGFDFASTPGLEHTRIVRVPGPRWSDVPAAETHLEANIGNDDAEVPGGWLTVRLLTAITRPPEVIDLAHLSPTYLQEAMSRSNDPDGMAAVVAILAAAGTGPILPFSVLERGLHELGRPRTSPQVRDILVSLGPLVQRGNAGAAGEHAGLAHIEITAAVADELIR